MIFWDVGALDIWRFIESTRAAAAAAAKVRRLSDDFRGRGCSTQTFKKTSNIWHMPSCGEARVPPLSAEAHLFTDTAFLRQPVMPIGERGGQGVVHRDPAASVSHAV